MKNSATESYADPHVGTSKLYWAQNREQIMANRAVSSFEVTGWEQTQYGDHSEGPKLGRATVSKSFSGDLAGESTADLLMCQADESGLDAGAGYVASELVVGRLGDLDGSFVLQHWGLTGGGLPSRTGGHVVPGSGTGHLAGLTGVIEISVDDEGAHTITIDYEIG